MAKHLVNSGNNFKDKFLKDAIEDHYTLKTKVKVVCEYNNKINENHWNMITILTKKKNFTDSNHRHWENEFLDKQKIVPDEYIQWHSLNIDSLEILQTKDKKEYIQCLHNKLEEIDKKVNNKETFNQYMSKNPILDINNIIEKKQEKEYIKIALDYFIDKHKSIMVSKINLRLDLIDKVLNNKIESVPDHFCIKFIENYQDISSVLFFASKGTVTLI